MHPVEFPQANAVIGANQAEYFPLPAFVENDGQVTSLWQLSWLERLRVLFTGRVFVTQLTFGRPLQPQLLMLRGPWELEEEDELTPAEDAEDDHAVSE